MSPLAQTYRLNPETVAAAKEAAYQRRISLNRWAQEAFDEKIAREALTAEWAAHYAAAGNGLAGPKAATGFPDHYDDGEDR